MLNNNYIILTAAKAFKDLTLLLINNLNIIYLKIISLNIFSLIIIFSYFSVNPFNLFTSQKSHAAV